MVSQNRFFPPLPKGLSFGNYRIEYVLNQDEMGVTYVAWDTERTAWAFIKESLPQASALREADGVQVKARDGMEDHYLRHLADFYEEADIMSKLDHPGVAKVLKFFRSGGTAYYAMPCDGEMSLGQWFEKNGQPEKVQLREWLRAMVGALGYLHSHELGPWDITPSSFMIKPDGTPVMVGFDVLRRLIGGNVDLQKSSPGFAGIELVKGENVGPWTDFYALGVTLYQLMAGEPVPVCTARQQGDMLIPLCNRPLLLKRYGESLLRTIDKAMAFAPADRWQSADEWLQALDSVPETEESLFCETPAPVAEESPEEPPVPAPEPEPAPAKQEPAPAPVAEPPAPAEPADVPEPVVQPIPELTDLLEPERRGKGSSARNALAVVGGVLLAVAGGAYLLMSDKPLVDITPEGADSPTVAKQPETVPAPATVAEPAKPEPVAVEPVKPEPVKPEPVAEEPTPEPQAPQEPVEIVEPEHEPAVTATTEPAVETPKPATGVVDLLSAVKSGDSEAAKRFLGQGATPQENHEALGAAISQGNVAMVTLLLENGGDMEAPFDKKMNALGYAIAQGKSDIAVLLLERGSNRNNRYEGNDTALMLAAQAGDITVVKALLGKGANVWIANANADTALTVALREGHVECAKLIIAANANVNAKNKQGMTPLKYAKAIPSLDAKKRDALIRLLKSNGAKE